MEADVYSQLWQQFCAALSTQQLQTDAFTADPSDDRRGITALAFLRTNSPAACLEVQRFQQLLAELEPAQYLQPAAELHLTVLSIISCISGFKLQQIELVFNKMVCTQ